MQYNNIMSSYPRNMYGAPRRPYQTMNPNNRYVGGGFLLPFALGFVSSPLIFGATRPRPNYYGPNPYPYYPYY